MTRGLTVALVGTDGSGKSTVAARLLREAGGPVRVVYMGLNSSKANTRVSLSRVADRLVDHESDDFRGGRPDTRGRMWAAVRLGYRVLEESLRFTEIAVLRRRGYLVVMDRHVRFDHVLGDESRGRLSERLHRAFLQRLTPLPDLLIWLDVPVATAIARSGEGTEEYHDRRRSAYGRAVAAGGEDAVRIDATQPIDDVVGEVMRTVEAHRR